MVPQMVTFASTKSLLDAPCGQTRKLSPNKHPRGPPKCHWIHKDHEKMCPKSNLQKRLPKGIKLDPSRCAKLGFSCKRGFNFHYFQRHLKYTLKVTPKHPKWHLKCIKMWFGATLKKHKKKAVKTNPNATYHRPVSPQTPLHKGFALINKTSTAQERFPSSSKIGTCALRWPLVRPWVSLDEPNDGARCQNDPERYQKSTDLNTIFSK